MSFDVHSKFYLVWTMKLITAVYKANRQDKTNEIPCTPPINYKGHGKHPPRFFLLVLVLGIR